MTWYSRDDLELQKFIRALALVKVDVHSYPRTTFTYIAGTSRVATRTDYDEDKTTIIRVLSYSYDGDGNVTEILDITP